MIELTPIAWAPTTVVGQPPRYMLLAGEPYGNLSKFKGLLPIAFAHTLDEIDRQVILAREFNPHAICVVVDLQRRAPLNVEHWDARRAHVN